MARITFVSFVGIVGIAGSVIALGGCGSSSGTVGTFGGIGSPGSPGSPGTSAAISGQSTAAAPPATGTAASSAGGSTAGGAGWVLSAPNTIFGFPQIKPSTTVLDKIQSELASSAGRLGVSGTQVIAVYDDQPHGLYVIFAGYNGSGFNPDRMQAAYQSAPVTTVDGTGNKLMIGNMTIDPGPHGGAAGCKSVMGQTTVATTEDTLCSWMTNTTLGSISTYPNLEHPNVTSIGPQTMAKVMRDLRDQVEHRS